MPILYSGHLIDGQKEYVVKCIMAKDIKINIYEKVQTRGLSSVLMSGADAVAGLMERPKHTLIGSYLSFIEKSQVNKQYNRRTLLYGNVKPAYKILELANHSFLQEEVKGTTEYPSAFGVMTTTDYEKELLTGKIVQNEILKNGVLEQLRVEEISQDNHYTLELKEDGKASATPTKDIKYHESVFDVGEIKENAIHTQIRSVQHLRSVKDISWIDKLIEQGKFRIVDTLEGVQAYVNLILNDMNKIGEKKIYYDTEGTGLNVFNLPPDHEAFDQLSAHVFSWVTERRAEDGYPLNVETIVIPVGMRYCDNADEIETIELLKPLLANPDIGVVSHNSDFELRINLRYSEIEGELSYREHFKWSKEMKAKRYSIDKEYMEEQLERLEKEYQEELSQNSGIRGKLKLAPLEREIAEIKAGLNSDNEIRRVRDLPKNEKPYLSKIKGEEMFRVNIKYDTLVLSRMANNGALNSEGMPFLRHDLKTLSKNYLDIDQLSLDDVFGNSQSAQYKIYDFSLLPREYMLYYACPDTYVMPFIEWHLERQAYQNMLDLGIGDRDAQIANVELLNLYYNVDVPFTLHMAEFANYKGIAINKDLLDKEKFEQEQVRDMLLEHLTQVTGEEIKWTSGKQVSPLVFTKYRYPVLYNTKEGSPSYNKATRQHHIRQTKDKHEPKYANVLPFPEMGEDLTYTSPPEHGQLEGETSVVLSAKVINNLMCPLSFIYQEFMNRHKDLTSFTKMIYERTFLVNDEWIYYPSYISTSTDTGRASGGIMIMKDSKKETFQARNNHVLFGGDLDQAELRLMATMSGDLNEINHFKDPRYDPHTKTAADVNGITQEQVTGKERNAAKVINFGDAYGMGANAAAANIYKDMVPVPEPLILKVAMLLKEFSRANPVKAGWLNSLRETATKVGFSKTPMGRYKWFPETKDPEVEKWELARAGRQGGNVPIQGFCADYIKQRLVSVYDVIKECNMSRYFTQPLFIHDEAHSEVDIRAFENAENKVYTNEMVKEEQQFNLMWLYDLMYSQFTERPLGLSYLEDEAPMTMGIGLAKTWAQVKGDLYGCPQEFQVYIINKYRNGELTDEFHSNLCSNPIETMLHEIRTWWAQETVIELEKRGVTPTNIPHNVGTVMEDLFLKRNLKDIFKVKAEELEELGLEKDDFLTAQVIKAIKYLNGEEVHLIESLDTDKVEIDTEGVEDANYSEVIDLSLFRQMKKEREESFLEDYVDYDYVFSESKLLEFGKLMINEDRKEIEINIDGMLSKSLVELEGLMRGLNGKGIYRVVIVGRKSPTQLPYKTINTTYKIPTNENVLLQIKSIFESDKKLSDQIELDLFRKAR